MLLQCLLGVKVKGIVCKSQQSNTVHQCISMDAYERVACLTDHARPRQLLGCQGVNVSQYEHAMFGS